MSVPLAGPARRVLSLAEDEARAAGHDHIGTDDLLLGLLAGDTDEHNTAFEVLDLLGIEYVPVRRLLDRDQPSPATRMPPTPEVTGVLMRAERDAQSQRRDQIDSAELLLALLTATKAEAADGGMVAQVLAQLGAEPDLLRGWILQARASETDPAVPNTASPPATTSNSDCAGEPGQTPESAASRQGRLGEELRAGVEAAWCGARHWVRSILAPRAT